MPSTPPASRVTFDQFLKDILHLAPDWIKQNSSRISEVVCTRFFQTRVSRYRDANRETSRYPAFIELANYIMDELGRNPESNIHFCRNDPVRVGGSRADRKPDVVGVRDENLKMLGRSSVDNLMDSGPNEACFWWTELLFFFELKFLRRLSLEDPRAHSPMVTLTSKRAPPSHSTPHKQTMSYKLAPTMVTCSTSRSLGLSASGSKHGSNTSSSNASGSHRSKRRKASDATSTDPMLQCCSYALEILSHGGLRSHVIGALVTDNNIQLLYFDRDLTLGQLGYVDVIKPTGIIKPMPSVEPHQIANVFDGLGLELGNTHLVLGHTIYNQHGIIGRGTCVVQATRINRSKAHCDGDGIWDGPLIMKLSWPASSRISENELIKNACEAADHDEHRWVLKHLPKVLYAEDQQINFLSQALIDRMGNLYEGRVLRILIQEQLYPITEQTTAHNLSRLFLEIFNCYKWLHEVPRILHRDISLNNLMFRKEGNNVYAVLNDFDLAVSVDARSTSSKCRTGTKPFMAIDLLGPAQVHHMYRHDLESLLYVLVWITSRFHDGKEIQDPPLQQWAELSAALQAKKKISRGYYGRTQHLRSVETKASSPEPGQEPGFEQATLGGLVTFATFQKTLDASLPHLNT
ncbi:hypothetical protein EDB86DRAFT_2825332 [Lactarius hatsudake]|nr:hypothetical protein EDB86DRAFT_2825332 [Lactarius hatsudake]